MFLLSWVWVTSIAVPTFATPSSGRLSPIALTIVTRDGRTYNDVKVQQVLPDGLVISYAPTNGGTGISKVKFVDLPDKLQKRYGYNPTNATAFEKAELKSNARLRAQLLAEDAKARSKRLVQELSDAFSDAKESGTGFFITDDGYLLTCYHVVSNATYIKVGTKQGVLSADLVQSDAANDVALLKVEGTFTALPLVASNSVRLGESVFTIGFPNPGVQGLEPKLTRGVISSLAGVQDNPGEYQISVPVQPGNSGSAVVDEYGNVTGIVAARLSDRAALVTSGMTAQDVNYAIKSSRIKALLDTMPELASKLKSPRPDKDRKFEKVVQQAQDAAVLVMTY